MKGATILLLSFICTAVCVQSYDPLGEFIRAQRTKASIDYVTGDVSGEYRPFIRAQRTKAPIDYATGDVSGEYRPVYVEPQEGMKEADHILSLPGQSQVRFSQYSGYVTVDPSACRALFYYFAESQDPSTKPLVLWLNVGGAMTELGPFRVNPDARTLWYNKNAWNNVANVIFLESPAGVRFSYSNKSSDYITGDKQTAADAYTFLVNWLERFPEYKTRDFYITGESYAGHYVPQLAALILKNNKIANQTFINLKGIAIGNAYIDNEDHRKGVFDYYGTHALVSDEIHQGIVDNCDFSLGPTVSQACLNYTAQAQKDKGFIFPYDIYAPWCSTSSNNPMISGFDPCSDNYVYAYLNRPEVQKALHANVTGIQRPWDFCNHYIGSNWQDAPLTVLPTIKELMASGIRVWMYSGDTDSVVPITTTRHSMPKLGTKVKTPWYPWYIQGEVGGYAVEYENLTFVSVRGAGHLVPSYQPERALTLFSYFLEGQLPPTQT